MADFNTKSTHDPIKALAYASNRKESYHIHLALKSQDGAPGLWKSTLDKVEKEFKTLYPEEEFKYQFLMLKLQGFIKRNKMFQGCSTGRPGFVFLSVAWAYLAL